MVRCLDTFERVSDTLRLDTTKLMAILMKVWSYGSEYERGCAQTSQRIY